MLPVKLLKLRNLGLEGMLLVLAFDCFGHTMNTLKFRDSPPWWMSETATVSLFIH